MDVNDIFQSSIDNEWTSKWRLAEVLEVTQQAVFVHFVGWSHRYDVWIDMAQEAERIAYVGCYP